MAKSKQSEDKVRDWAQFVGNLQEKCIQSHRGRQLDMMKCLNFYMGNHYMQYNETTGKLVNKSEGITINRIKPVVRSVANNLSKLRPKWTVTPLEYTKEATLQAELTGNLLDKYYDILGMKWFARQIAKNAIIMKIGWAYVGWDESKNGGKGDVIIRLENPFYIFFDPSATEISNARYIIRIVQRTLQDVKNDKSYDSNATSLLRPQVKLGATPIFQTVMTRTEKVPQNDNAVDNDESLGNVYLTECYLKEMVEEEYVVEEEDILGEMMMTQMEAVAQEQASGGINGSTEGNNQDTGSIQGMRSGEGINGSEAPKAGTVREEAKKPKIEKRMVLKIRYIVVNQGQVLKNEITDLVDFPFEPYYCTKNPLTMDGESWVQDLIPLNIAINKFKTQQILYADRLPGGFVLRNGGDIKISSLSDGTKVYKIDGKLTKEIPQVNLPPLPNIDMMISGLITDFGDLASVHDVSMGKGDMYAKSGVAIENLIDADSNNMIELKENMEDWYSRVGKKVLWNIAKYGAKVSTVSYEKDNQRTKLSYIGGETPLAEDINEKLFEQAFRTGQSQDVDSNEILRIAAENDVKVSIDTDLAYTPEAMFQRLTQLYQMQIVDKKTVLEVLKFGNIGQIIERMEAEQQQEQSAQQQQQEQAMQMQQQQQAMQMQQQQQLQEQKNRMEIEKAQYLRPQTSINYKDLPPSGKVQAAAQDGIILSPQDVINTEGGVSSPEDIINKFAQQAALRRQISAMIPSINQAIKDKNAPQ